MVRVRVRVSRIACGVKRVRPLIVSAVVFLPFNCFQFSLSFILLIKSFIHLYITLCTFIHLNIYTSRFVLLNCFVLVFIIVFKKFHELLVCKNAK